MRAEHAHEDDCAMTRDITISVFPKVTSKSTNDIVTAIQSLERRNFPSSEALTIAAEVAKRNTNLLYAQSTNVTCGYLIYINTSFGIRIHKLCVAESFRHQKVATAMIKYVCNVAQKTGKDIDLWVDERRWPARRCYLSCGFLEVDGVVVDYYGNGRNGIRMVWSAVRI